MKELKKIRETDNLEHLYRNKLGKACFTHDAAYSDSKDLAKRTIWDKIWVLASMVYKFFEKKTILVLSVNDQLAAELHKPVIKKIKGRKTYARFKDNIWVAD